MPKLVTTPRRLDLPGSGARRALRRRRLDRLRLRPQRWHDARNLAEVAVVARDRHAVLGWFAATFTPRISDDMSGARRSACRARR